MRASIQRKYSLIRYMYTHITQISLATQNYQTLYKPLFFEFPNDNGAFNDIANNVMLGGALKTSVNAKSLNATMTNFYFPAGTWCSVFAPVGNCIYNAVSQNVSLPSGLDQSYVHLREGYIVPMQDAVAINAKTTADLLNAPVDFHILGTQSVPGLPNWRAEGMYLNDDGLTTNVTGNVNQYRITVSYSRSQGENIYLTIVQSMTASNYLNT
jgi:alpha-glucosidase (family GH31 glycosyl hydrolase)